MVLPANSRMQHKRTATLAYAMFGLLANRDGWRGESALPFTVHTDDDEREGNLWKGAPALKKNRFRFRFL